MKPIYSYIFSFISFFSFYNSIFCLEPATHKEEKLPALAALVDDMAFPTLIYTMHTLEDNLDYWQNQLKNSRNYTIFRSSAKTESAIKEHIRALKDIELIHAKALGKLHILRNTDTTSLEYCTKMLEILSAFMNITPEPDDKKLDDKNLEKRLSAAISQLSTYKKSFDRAISAHTKPSHLARNWWKYLLGIAAISALGFTAYEYKQNIWQWYQQGLETIQKQWQQRIVDPINGIIRNLSLQTNETNQKDLEKLQQEIETLPSDIKHLKNILDIRKEAFEKETRIYYQRRSDIPQDEIDAYVDRLHHRGDDTDVMGDLIKQGRYFKENIRHEAKELYQNTREKAPNWVKYLLPTTTPAQEEQEFRLLEPALQLINFYKLKADKKELELQEIILNCKKLFYEVKQQWYLQEVNAMFGAMFPAALTGYAAYKLSTNAFSTLFFKKVVLIPLQERILSIRKMLNRFDDGEQKELSAENMGHLLYWAHKLRQYIVQIPDEQQESFKQDIQELESMELTIKQKHEVVKRMYDVYGFLKVTEYY